MGRETKILLALLGLLAGVFVGVLSMKLLVPRPPVGAGPDIHDEIAAATPAAIVEPPALAPAERTEDGAPEAVDRYAQPGRASSFAAPGEETLTEPEPLAADIVEAAVPLAAVDEQEPPAAESASPITAPPSARPLPAVAVVGYEPPAPLSGPGGSYVAAAGDSWWSLAERTYGDGRLYRALFAWNRAVNPRVSLVPGTSLQLPTRSQLATAWPQFMPRE